MKIYFYTLLLALLVRPVLAGESLSIEGNKRIETDTIKSYFLGRDLTSKEELNSILKNLYATNLFSDINMSLNGDDVKVTLKENPVINKIEIVGNKSLSDDIIKQEMELAEREVYTKSSLIDDVIRITEIYKRSGRIKAEVVPKVKVLENNRLDLILDVTENDKSKISKIIFHGNKRFKKKKLHKVLSSKEKKWYRSSTSFYDPDRVAFDKQLLTRFYYNEGYANFSISDVKVEYLTELNSFLMNYQLQEGEVYHFANYSFDNQYENFKVEELYKLVKFKPGDRFSLEKIEKSVDEILSYLNDKGFAFADVEYHIDNDHLDHTSNIKFSIKKNKKIYIRRIKVSGNTRTEDKVIRREIRILEGDPFNNTKIQRSKQRLTNLGFFSNVAVKKVPVPGKSLIDIVFEVEEKPTGELNFGFGYSTTEKFLGNVTIKERNLMGKAHSVAASIQKSSRSNDIDLSYTVPNVANRDFSFGVDLFNLQTEYSESLSEIKTQGASTKIYYELTEYLSQSLSYTLKEDKVTDVDSTASIFIQEQEGKTLYSGVAQSLFYDKRDNRLNPTDGHYLKFTTTWAGVGGDTKFLKLETGGVNYQPYFSKKIIIKTLLKMGAISGYNGKDIKINNRFFLGGASLKGFQTAGVGPRDSDGTALGGKYFFKGTLEMLFPLGLPEELGFKGSVFSDFGTLTGLDDKSVDILDQESIRVSAGLGVAWESPLGPIRFDYAKPLKKEAFDKTESFRINFGTRF